MKYVIYLRVSTDKQDVAMQEKACMDYIKNKVGGKRYELEIFSDPDTSSRIKMDKRPGLIAMLSSLRRGHQVVVYKLDRFSRDVIEMVTIFRMIRDRQCRIHSLNDSGCDDEFTVGLMGVLAQKEREDISIRTKSAMSLKRKRGEKLGGDVAFGFQVEKDGKTLKENPEEQKVLQKMCSLYDMGLSYRGICFQLMDAGHFNREGRPFKPMSVYRILLRTGRPAPYDPALEEREYQASLQ